MSWGAPKELPPPVRRAFRVGIVIVVCLSSVISLLFLVHDGSVLRQEPAPGSIPTGQEVRVFTQSCGFAELMIVTGATWNTERERDCEAISKFGYVALWTVFFVEDVFGRLYTLLVIVGSVAAGMGALMVLPRFWNRDRR